MSELSFQLSRVINPYPDELFGSWVTRVILRNGVNTWDYLAECAGYTHRPRGYDDLPEYSERLGRLLAALRISYVDAQNNLSTHPFGLALGRSSADFTKETASEEQQSRSLSRAHGGALRVWGMRLKWCAECIGTSDLNPYWQRAHQLPSSVVCHIHGRILQWRCPFCGRSELIKSRILAPLPDINCGCGGGDPLSISGVYESSEALRKLALFSSDVVRGGLPRWNKSHLLHVAREEIIQNFGGYSDMYSFMRSYYSMIPVGRKGVKREFYSGGKFVEALHLWGGITGWTPPMFACFFSSIGWSYSKLCEKLRETVNFGASMEMDVIDRSPWRRIRRGLNREGADENSEKNSPQLKLNFGSAEDELVICNEAENTIEKREEACDPEFGRSELDACYAAFFRISLPDVFPRKVTKTALAIEMGLSIHVLEKLLLRQADFWRKINQYNESIPRLRIEFALKKMEETGVRKSARGILAESLLGSCNSITYNERMNMIHVIAQSREEWRSMLIPPGGLTGSHVCTY